jgi:hypothetical protein
MGLSHTTKSGVTGACYQSGGDSREEGGVVKVKKTETKKKMRISHFDVRKRQIGRECRDHLYSARLFVLEHVGPKADSKELQGGGGKTREHP